MAIVKMRKLNLIAMSYDKDAVLDALQRTGAAEVTLHSDAENTVVPPIDDEKYRAYYASVETVLDALCATVERVGKERGEDTALLKDGFDVTYSEFLSARDRKEETDGLVAQINALTDGRNELKAELSKLSKQKADAEIYATLQTPFAEFADTTHVAVRLGTAAVGMRTALEDGLHQTELCDYHIVNATGESVLYCIVYHKSAKAETDGVLSAYGFTDCPYKGEKTGAQTYAELCEQEGKLQAALVENEENMYALKDCVRSLKIYCDYLAFALEKENANGKLRATERTFLLQAYVPAPAEEEVSAALKTASQAMYMEFSDPTEEDEPPTLLHNNGLVSNFESITNTYSAPNYREFDPNGIMSLFYSIFMGFIIADAGYGLTMLLGGGFLWWKGRKRPTGMSKLAGAFAFGGVFAVIWGLLFNSMFGFTPLPFTVMPNAQSDMWHIAGIAVPSVLIIAMELGIAQLCVGYLCKAVQEWRRGHVLDGIFGGVAWAVFSVGVALAIVGFTQESDMPIFKVVGGIIAGASLAIAVLTAGIHEKGFGKFTKSFGSAYGVINYASDVLSYARLYGLMLSGAVIATIIADNCKNFLASGNVLFIALAVVLLVVGNGFNLVMNLLGAYIHDARLQYVEFYGRFFEGEGELFKPLGSEHKHVYLLREPILAKKTE